MKKGTFKHIEDILRDYPKINQYLKEREEELMYPLQQDNNVGGSRSTLVDKPTERKVITILEDKQLRQMKRQKEAIEYAFESSDVLTCEMIKLYYMSKTKKTWEIVAFELYNGQISIRTLKRSRTLFFEKIANALGWEK
ncbi:DUF722 domain-containing protein [Carnobacteriaceae bacterium zg-ZUI78]|nr:DUF722 domain-containing protein [Carnobacteriaceae bacterium zg-ZUI78]